MPNQYGKATSNEIQLTMWNYEIKELLLTNVSHVCNDNIKCSFVVNNIGILVKCEKLEFCRRRFHINVCKHRVTQAI